MCIIIDTLLNKILKKANLIMDDFLKAVQKAMQEKKYLK